MCSPLQPQEIYIFRIVNLKIALVHIWSLTPIQLQLHHQKVECMTSAREWVYTLCALHCRWACVSHQQHVGAHAHLIYVHKALATHVLFCKIQAQDSHKQEEQDKKIVAYTLVASKNDSLHNVERPNPCVPMHKELSAKLHMQISLWSPTIVLVSFVMKRT